MSSLFRSRVILIAASLTACQGYGKAPVSEPVEIPGMITIMPGKFLSGSDYSEKIACKNGVPPLIVENADSYCKEVGPSNWFEDEYPPIMIEIENSYEISETEITVRQFRDFINETAYVTTAEIKKKSLGIDGDPDEIDVFKAVSANWRHPWPEFGKLNPEEARRHPVTHVSWADAVAYTNWLSAKTGDNWRLPTRYEWEYAALGSQKTFPSSGTYSWGGSIGETLEANVSDRSFATNFPEWRYPVLARRSDGFAFTSPVKSYAANDFGLYDMTGNVWEWTLTFAKAETAGAGDEFYPVMKGGSFDFEMPFQRIQKNRTLAFAGTQYDIDSSISIGFRVVKIPGAGE